MIDKQDKEKSIDGLGKDLYTQLIEAKQLTIKEIRFCAEYLVNGLNGTRAYLLVYYDNDESKYNASSVESHKLLRKTKIKEVIIKVNNEWLESKKMSYERKIIDSLEKKAFYDPATFITKNGLPAFDNFEDIPKNLRHCITGIVTRVSGNKKNRTVRQEIKLTDQHKALEMLGKYMTLFKEDININLNKMDPEASENLKRIFGERDGEKKK